MLAVLTKIFSVIIFCVVAIFTFGLVFVKVPRGFFWFVFASSLALIALMLGSDMLHIQTERGGRSHTIKTATGDLDAVILRSGDRGIMIYDRKQKSFALVRWEGITAIEVKRDERSWRDDLKTSSRSCSNEKGRQSGAFLMPAG